MNAECNPIVAITCADDVAGDVVSGAADSFMERLVQSTLDGLVEIVGTFGTSMFAVDSPSVGTDDGRASSTLTAVSSSLEWVVLLVGTLSMMAAVIRMFWTLDAGTEGRVIVRMMINVVASSSLVIGMTTLLLRASDEFSLWALYAISGHREQDLNTGDKFAKALLGGNILQDGQMMQGLSLIAIILIIVAAAGSIMQFLWMIVRSPLIIATVAFIPAFAASTGFRTGQERFNKALMFLLACVLYKPVAAVLYGLGLRMMQGQGDDNPLQEFMWGTTLLLLVGIAGPAMIKFFVAEAAVGTSNAFSGAAGIAAAGAAVYGAAALGATFASGGAAAGAGGGGAAVGTAPLGGGGSTPPGGGAGAQHLPPGGGGGGPAPRGGGVGGGPTPPGGGVGGGLPQSGGPASGAGADGSTGGADGPPPMVPATGGDAAGRDGSSGGGSIGSGVVGASETGGPTTSGAARSTSGAPAPGTTSLGGPAGGGSSTPGSQSVTGASTEEAAAGSSSGADSASGTGAPVTTGSSHGTGGARVVGSRAKRTAHRAWQSGTGAVTATGAAIDDMSESARAGYGRG